MVLDLSSLTTDAIRSQIRQSRREFAASLRITEQHKIYQQITKHPKIIDADNIAIFLSFDGELDTMPIIEQLWQQKKAVYIPIIHPFNRHYLLFIRYRPETHLITNKWGIRQPKLNLLDVLPHHQLDVILTPLVAFDSRNYRIGMGGGYYDRMLTDYQKHTVYPIGLAFSCQQISHINNQPWDIQLAEVISGS